MPDRRGEEVCVRPNKGLACSKPQELTAAWPVPRAPQLFTAPLQREGARLQHWEEPNGRAGQFQTRGKVQDGTLPDGWLPEAGGKAQGLRRTSRQLHNSPGAVKHSLGIQSIIL